MKNKNRIDQTSEANGEYAQQSDTLTVPVWVKLLLAASILMLGSAATALPPPWNLVAGAVALGVTGAATYLGMTVGAPRK